MTIRYEVLKSWKNIRETPYYFFYYYVPRRYDYFGSETVSCESQKVRRDVWSFKDGKNQNQIILMLEKKLKHTFDNTESLTFVCIPASTNASNKIRYENFSNTLCKNLNMLNGFGHISIIQEKVPSHLGGTGSSTYEFDKAFFKGKKVILFDDVVTKGSSMLSFISYLEEVGAEIVCCISIGKTFWDRILSYKICNPWSGNIVFNCGSATEPDKDNREFNIENSVLKEIDEQTDETITVSDNDINKFDIDFKVTSIVTESKKSTNEITVPETAEPKLAIIEKKSEIGDVVRIGRFKGMPLEWIILDQNDDEYLVISKFGLECMPFNNIDTFITWDRCSLRKWLNEEFYNSTFNNDEKKKIVLHEVIANGNPIYRTDQGDNTNDRLFILNINEYNYYFDIYNKWSCKLFSGILRQCWLRNSGNDNGHASFIGRSGSVHAGGSKVNSPRNAIRPVFWVKL